VVLRKHLYRQEAGSGGTGKELADLLVVCGDDVLIFSDKAIEWPENVSIELAWVRWYRRAIEKSVAQIRGAERWITNFPNRIFLDQACTQRFPIDLPPIERRRVHGIIVAIGATEAVREFCNDDSGTFCVSGILKGAAHTTPNAAGHLPFSFGDIDPAGSFIHVFDPTALDIVMRELDTVSDLTDYLRKRAEFIRSGRFLFAPGEEDLLAFYLQNMGNDNSHDFVSANLDPALNEYAIQVAPGEYNAFIKSPEYRRQKIADRISYVWDRLIELFVEHVLAGISVALLGHEPNAALAERGLRLMALENRVYRRLLARSLSE
jgi:hypothetical protein